MPLLSGRLSVHSARFWQLSLKFLRCTIKTIKSFCLRPRYVITDSTTHLWFTLNHYVSAAMYMSAFFNSCFILIVLVCHFLNNSPSVSGSMCDRFRRKFDVQTSYKPLNYVLCLIFVVNIKFPWATYNMIVPPTEGLLFKKWHTRTIKIEQLFKKALIYITADT